MKQQSTDISSLLGTMAIAGAGKGLGRSLAKEAWQKGFQLALISRTENDLSDLKKEIVDELKADNTRKITSHIADLSDESQAKKIFKEIKDAHGQISVLVNCAATWTGGRSVLDLSKNDIQRSLELNFFYAFNAIKEVLGLHGASSKPLSIINVGATASLRGGTNMAAYGIAKSSLRILSQSLAKELGPKGVHVAHFVIDGLIDNARTRELNPGRPENRYMKPESIAREIIHVALQTPDCWTFEWEGRTFNAEW